MKLMLICWTNRTVQMDSSCSKAVRSVVLLATNKWIIINQTH